MVRKYTQSDWSDEYVQLLDAIGEYMDGIAKRQNTEITERDITIIRALIDFYDFQVDSWEDVMDIISDVVTRTEEQEAEEFENKH
jgi:hypothetical protein